MEKSSPARGRPRSVETRDVILAATFALLLERGYADMSIEAVAQAAGAGKATIYRWWQGKAELAVEAFLHATAARLELPNTTCAADDFRIQITELAAFLRGPRGVVFAAMLGAARTDPALALALGEGWLERRRAWGLARMHQAVARGECHPAIEIPVALGLLYGPLYAPLLFGQPVPEAPQVAAHLALALPAVFRQA